MKKNIAPRVFSEGFTLLELVVVFSIIAVLSTISISSFVSFSRNQTLQQAQNDLINVLNTAKAKTVSQVKPSPACTNYNTLNGYSVSIDTAAQTYTLNVVCSGTTNPLPPPTPLPHGVTFNSSLDNPPTTTTSVFFSVLTGAVSGSGNIVLTSFGQTRTITITSEGTIQ